MFICLEGIDGSGTTSLARNLGKLLTQSNVNHLCTYLPSSGPIGTLIRSFLRKELFINPDDMLGLFLADISYHLDHVIKPALDQGKVVICDRYCYSTWCYQLSSYSADVLRPLLKKFLAPTYVYVLKVSNEVAHLRRQKRKGQPELFETAKLQQEVALRYQIMVEVCDEPYGFRLGKEEFVVLNSETHKSEELANFVLEHSSHGTTY